MQRTPALAPVSLATVLLATVSFAQAADKTQLDIGEEAPSFRLKVMNAKEAAMPTFDIADVAGPDAPPETKKKLVLLSFFATYCEPCKRELPFLAALHEEYKDKGLQIVSVSIDKEEDKIALIKGLIDKDKLVHPVLVDRFQAVAKRYYVAKLPCLYMIDPDKNVSKVAVGYDDNAMRDVLADVRSKLGLPATDPLPARLAKFIKEPQKEPAKKVEEVADAKGADAKGKKKSKK